MSYLSDGLLLLTILFIHVKLEIIMSLIIFFFVEINILLDM